MLFVSPEVSHLFLVPFEIREEDEADLRVRIFISDPLGLCLLLQDVVHPLMRWQKQSVLHI